MRLFVGILVGFVLAWAFALLVSWWNEYKENI